MKKSGYLRSDMRLKDEAEMSCGKALISIFNQLSKFQYESQKEECYNLVEKTFKEKNVPKEYADQMLESMKKESFKKMMDHIGNVVLKGYGQGVI